MSFKISRHSDAGVWAVSESKVCRWYNALACKVPLQSDLISLMYCFNNHISVIVSVPMNDQLSQMLHLLYCDIHLFIQNIRIITNNLCKRFGKSVRLALEVIISLDITGGEFYCIKAANVMFIITELLTICTILNATLVAVKFEPDWRCDTLRCFFFFFSGMQMFLCSVVPPVLIVLFYPFLCILKPSWKKPGRSGGAYDSPSI